MEELKENATDYQKKYADTQLVLKRQGNKAELYLGKLLLVLLILGVLSSLFLGSYLGQKFDAVFGWIIAIGGIAQSVFVYLCLKVFVNISENMRKIKNYLLFRDGLDDDEEPDYVEPETSDDEDEE